MSFHNANAPIQDFWNDRDVRFGEVLILPLKDCVNCAWKAFGEPGGHCYMFREEPAGDRCGQFKKVEQTTTSSL